MTRFLQFHALTVYPPSNPNRDDSNRPKTVRYGFVERLRISSQSLKRAWRISTEFLSDIGHIGARLANSKKTHTFEDYLKKCFAGEIKGFTKTTTKEADQNKIIKALIKELTNDKDVLVFLSHAELERVHEIVRNGTLPAKPSTKTETEKKKGSNKKAAGQKGENKQQTIEILEARQDNNIEQEANNTDNTDNAEDSDAETSTGYGIFQKDDLSADVVMFGRMMTETPRHNVEAAVQVSHAFTVHAGSVEDDYFTAIDDIKQTHFPELTGAFLPDSRAFGGGGVYYLYVCVDVDLLLRNLKGNEDLAQQAIRGLLNAMTTVAPSGMQNSFGSRVRCEYLLAEYGAQQPRSLATAFLQAVYGSKDENPLELAKRRLETTRQQIDEMYGNSWEEYRVAGSTEREIKEIAENASPEDKIKLEQTNQHSEQHNNQRTDIPGIIDFCITKVTNHAKQEVQPAAQVQEQEGKEKAS